MENNSIRLLTIMQMSFYCAVGTSIILMLVLIVVVVKEKLSRIK